MRTELTITPLTEGLRRQMAEVALLDGKHYVPLATHAFLRAGEIVGGAAVAIPTTIFWAHSERLHARETFELAKRIREMSPEQFLTVCWERSPLHPFMPKLGYRRLGTTDVFQS